MAADLARIRVQRAGRRPARPFALLSPPVRSTWCRMSFVHLHVHTNFSFGDGAGRIDELVDAARRLGMPALAVTDHDGLYGAVFPPNPPPTNGVITLTSSVRKPSAFATSSLAPKGACVEAQTVALFPSILTTAVCGSIGACATYALKYVCSRTEADSFSPAVRSPPEATTFPAGATFRIQDQYGEQRAGRGRRQPARDPDHSRHI